MWRRRAFDAWPQVTQGIMRLNLDYKRPVIFGVLCCMTEEQATERAGLHGTHGNAGIDWGSTAVHCVFCFCFVRATLPIQCTGVIIRELWTQRHLQIVLSEAPRQVESALLAKKYGVK